MLFTNKPYLFVSILLCLVLQGNAQVQYNGCTTTGSYSSAIGNKNTASGNNAFAGGYTTQATGSNSFAFGYNSKATQSTTTAIGNTAIASGAGSIAIGNYVKATAKNAFVFGAGTTASYPLTNSTANSIAFGVNSNKPTLLITKSLNNNYTGKVAIGNVVPTAKLHIRSDNNEDASVFIEPTNKTGWKACINLFDSEHSITVDNTAIMQLHAGNGSMQFQGDHFCFGEKKGAQTRLYTHDKAAIYYNARRDNGIETRDDEGPSYALDFNNNGIQIRTATYQIPRDTDITNWKNALSISTDGKIGIGSQDIYLHSNSDSQLIINSPKNMELHSSNITLSGKIGINTTNNVNGYALAVDGGIISNKVYVKEVNQWPDYVFSEDYDLMDLEELKNYLDEHKHLPGVPSKAEVINNGYDVNEMQQTMLRKIEEMTRYILMLQEEINELKTSKGPQNNPIVFSYDANGNRISKSITFERILKPDSNPPANHNLSYGLYPNPTQGQFSIITNKATQEGKLHATLSTITGVPIVEKESYESQIFFDLSAHPSGIYLLEVDGPEGHQSWKVIKQ